MPGGGKGPTSSGNITQTTVNPTQSAQLPHLQEGWDTAGGLKANNPLQYYPGQTLADYNPFVGQGYGTLVNHAIGIDQNYLPTLNSALTGAAGGSHEVANSPAFAGLNGIAGSSVDPTLRSGLLGIANTAGAGADPQRTATNLTALANQASSGADPGAASSGLTDIARSAVDGSNPALASLTKTANGDYLGANPHLDALFRAAADPVTRAYQTATAPQTDSAFERSGRYGSGAMMNARSQNEQNLGKTLGDLGTNLYGQDYANERGLMTTAGGLLDTAHRGGLAAGTSALSAGGGLDLGRLGTGASALASAGGLNLGGLNAGTSALSAGGALDTGNLGQRNTALSTLQSGFQGGGANEMQALALAPSIANMGFTDANHMISGALGLTGMDQAHIADAMARFYGNQNAPWDTNAKFLSQVGQPTAGSNQVTSPLLGPSALSQGISGLTGLSALNSSGLFGSSGLGGLLGGSATNFGMSGGLTGAEALPGFDTLGGTIGMGAADVGGGGGGFLSTLLPFLFA